MRGYIERANLITGAALNVNGNAVFSRELPVGEGWYKTMVRVNIAVVIGTGAGPISEGELRFIRGILFKTDRGEIIANLPARALYKFAHYITGQAPRKDAIAAATATYAVNIPIIHADPKLLRPEDTVLDTSRYNSLTLQISLGTVADLFTAPGTATVTATVDVEVERSFGRLPELARPIGFASFDYRAPVDANVTTNIDFERSSDMSVMRALVHSAASGTAGLPFSGDNADDVQDVVTIKDESRFIEKERKHEMIQDINKIDGGLETVLAGYEVFDFVRDRSIASAMATGQKSVLQYAWTNKAGVAANDIVTLATQSIRTLK